MSWVAFVSVRSAQTEVADEFGTRPTSSTRPTFVIGFGATARRSRRLVLVYAGKALLTTAIARWVAEERAGLGVSSGGELATALVAGADPNQIVVLAWSQTPGELCKAANVGVGRIVVGNPTEVAFLAAGVRQPQAVQVRVSPDIDFHEGSSGDRRSDRPDAWLRAHRRACRRRGPTGTGSAAARSGRSAVSYRFAGDRRFAYTARPSDRWSPLMAEVRARHGVILTELNIGGGQGVPYVSGDP